MQRVPHVINNLTVHFLVHVAFNVPKRSDTVTVGSEGQRVVPCIKNA